MTFQSFSIKLLIGAIICAPLLADAQGYVNLVGLPGPVGSERSTQGFINALYQFAIAGAAFLAVGQIIIAGVKYMLTDVVTAKGDAKRHIRGALLGLVIVLSSALILQTINPELTNLEFLRSTDEKLSVSGEGSAGSGTVSTDCPDTQVYRCDIVVTSIREGTEEQDCGCKTPTTP